MHMMSLLFANAMDQGRGESITRMLANPRGVGGGGHGRASSMYVSVAETCDLEIRRPGSPRAEHRVPRLWPSMAQAGLGVVASCLLQGRNRQI